MRMHIFQDIEYAAINQHSKFGVGLSHPFRLNRFVCVFFACFVVLFLFVFGGCQNFRPAHVSHAAQVSQRSTCPCPRNTFPLHEYHNCKKGCYSYQLEYCRVFDCFVFAYDHSLHATKLKIIFPHFEFGWG
jgi:hypothetical protein